MFDIIIISIDLPSVDRQFRRLGVRCLGQETHMHDSGRNLSMKVGGFLLFFLFRKEVNSKSIGNRKEIKMNYYEQIKNKLIENEIYNRVKDYSKERHKVLTYYEIGKILNDAGKHYGERIIEEYSKKLINDVGKKYNKRTLFRIRQFYVTFSNQKVSPVATQLTWSHYSELLSLKDKSKLRERIKNKEYERLSIEAKEKIFNNKELELKDFVPNPILVRNKNNIDIITEKVLHQVIMEDLSSFLKELGSNICFVDTEYRIKLGYKYNYIDFLLYNIKYRCYVVIELKVTTLKKEHIGQIQIYMNYIDKNVKSVDDNKTAGIIICKRNDQYVIEYCSDERIIAREYKLI